MSNFLLVYALQQMSNFLLVYKKAYAYWFMNFSNPPPTIKQQGNANTTCDNTFNPPKCRCCPNAAINQYQ